jgi:adenylate cyclase
VRASAIRLRIREDVLKAISKKRSKKGAKAPKAARTAKSKARKTSLKALPGGAIASVAELAQQRELNRFADGLLEECHHERLSIRATLNRFLPAISSKMGAIAGILSTRDEQLNPEIFEFGSWDGADKKAISDQEHEPYHQRYDAARKRTTISQTLDIGGETVGAIGFAFAGNRLAEAKLLHDRVEMISEELDFVLAGIQLAAFKQEEIIKIGQALRNVVFDRGVDDAVSILEKAIPIRDFVLLYHDDASGALGMHIRYRIYREGICVNDSETRPHARLSELILREGQDVLEHSRAKVQPVLGLDGALESMLISGLKSSRTLGKIIVTAEHGLSTFGHDLLRVFAESVSQRLVDYNRERRHLSQFFSAAAINELLRDPAYNERWLTPRVDDVALLYADINSFTKISEQVLKDPAKIGRFVDKWSAGAVDILFKYGGVFDKMVGDCVIGIFGPPFFRQDKRARIAAALKAGREILQFTVGLEADTELAPIASSGVVKGLGVAVGVNLCPASVGLFGPNQEYTAFSSGMNATARLQSLAGFREILIMDSAKEALGDLDPGLREASFEGPAESPVKNVAKPLRYFRVKFPEMK